MTHTLTIQHKGTHNSSATPDADGNYVVAIVRKSLSDSEITPANLRYNTGSGTVQRTLDGGSTWIDSPTDDPRYNPIGKKTPRTGSSIPCYSAINAVHYLKAQVDTAINGTSEAVAIIDGIAVLASFFPEIGLAVDFFAAVVAAVLTLGQSTVNTAMSTTVYDTLRDIIACNISPDGSVNHTQLLRIEAQVTALIGGTASTVINLMLTSWGEVGLQNAAATGSLTGTCSGTGCKHYLYLDFTIDQHGGQGANVFCGVLISRGEYIPGYGWTEKDDGAASTSAVSIHLLGTSGDYNLTDYVCYFDGVLSPTGQVEGIFEYDHAHLFNTPTVLTQPTAVSGKHTLEYHGAIVGQGLGFQRNSNVNGSKARCYGVLLGWDTSDVLSPTYTPNY